MREALVHRVSHDTSRTPTGETDSPAPASLRVVGLFAGIGGIELGLAQGEHESVLLCEIDPAAKRVLEERFRDAPLVGDVRELSTLPPSDLVAAGFPCQDLSQAGRTAGIAGRQSRLVDHVFRLLQDASPTPQWLLLENVPFMLQLDGGQAMHYLTCRLSEMGYTWAYRIVDTRAFGLPQRRRRVLLLASQTEDPRTVLFSDEAGEPPPTDPMGRVCGFYWTEGLRGLGLAVESVPTLKGGSGLGIPSPPAIWVPRRGVYTPDLRDAERLQGFPADWTASADAVEGGRRGTRWKLVGNAVSVPVAAWLGARLREPGRYDSDDLPLAADAKWPRAAWGNSAGRYRAELSAWPRRTPAPLLLDFLVHPLRPLSPKATAGFLRRIEASTLRTPMGFLEGVRGHLDAFETATTSA